MRLIFCFSFLFVSLAAFGLALYSSVFIVPVGSETAFWSWHPSATQVVIGLIAAFISGFVAISGDNNEKQTNNKGGSDVQKPN